MVVPPTDSSLSLTDPKAVKAVRKRLEQANYCERKICKRLGITEYPTYRQRRRQLPLYLHRTRELDPLDVLIRLFVMHEPVSFNAAKEAVSPAKMDDWTTLGLLKIKEDTVIGAVELCPYEQLIAAADWPLADSSRRHQVMGVAATTRTLADMTVRRPVKQALDLGTGCGVLSFLMAAHSEHVAAVDCNPRAITFARFNAQLNGYSDITWLEGNFFEPVREQKFHLITCNPPFVIAPVVDAVSTHSGYPADELCKTIVQTASAFLNEGGFCQVLCNWVQTASEDWRERLATWTKGLGCDVWVLHSHSEKAAAYALERISEQVDDAEEVRRQFEEWMTYYERQRIESIGFGLIVLRRSGRSVNWFHCQELAGGGGRPSGEDIENAFVVRDFLEDHQNDQTLSAARLRRANHLSVQQQLDLTPKGWSTIECRLHKSRGFGVPVNVDPQTMAFVADCRGDRSLGEYLKEIAKKAGQDPQRLAPGFLKVVRRLVELGILISINEKADP